jgi:predicted NBD/HSP70 family sugar kinase
MTTRSIDTGIVLAYRAERVEENHYFVMNHAVALEDDACSCGEYGCWHMVAATIAQAQHNNA